MLVVMVDCGGCDVVVIVPDMGQCWQFLYDVEVEEKKVGFPGGGVDRFVLLWEARKI